MTIKDLKPGMSATVQTLLGHGALKRRMLDMGITRGTKVVMNKRAPFGDPLIINVRGYTLSLRGEDAESVSSLTGSAVISSSLASRPVPDRISVLQLCTGNDASGFQKHL